MTANPTAPAAMPGEEEIARAMRTARLKATSAAPMLIGYSGLAPAEDADLASARAILSLFAPILAEKERAERERDEWHAAHGRAATRAYEQGERADAAEARALAAEAALAAESERHGR